MRKIKVNEIDDFKDILKELPILPSNTVLFFPIELEKEIKEVDGISMMMASLKQTSGSNGMIKYGICIGTIDGPAISASLYNEEAAITLNLSDYSQIIKVLREDIGGISDENISQLKELECRILKHDSILFSLASI